MKPRQNHPCCWLSRIESAFRESLSPLRRGSHCDFRAAMPAVCWWEQGGGGRRYWSEDLEDMRRLGAALVEQVERFRAEELKRLVSQAELRALQAQINPHFLFNAFNTLYGTIDRGSREARRMVLNLADIFRYFLQSHRTVIPLSEELRIVRDNLEI